MDELTQLLGLDDGYHVLCHLHGDVTAEESGFNTTRGVLLVQAGLYRQRHLAKHLVALAAEIEGASR